MIYSPKEQFQKYHEQALEEFRKVIPQPWMLDAMNHALSEFAYEGATEQELSGVRRFIHVLVNLQEKPEATPKLPTITLKSYDDLEGALAELLKKRKTEKK